MGAGWRSERPPKRTLWGKKGKNPTLFGDVVHQQRANRAPVVGRRDGAVPLLAGGVPNLGFHGLAVDLDRPRREFDADRALALQAKLVAREAGEQVGFADAGVADEDDLEEVVVAGRGRKSDGETGGRRRGCRSPPTPRGRRAELGRLSCRPRRWRGGRSGAPRATRRARGHAAARAPRLAACHPRHGRRLSVRPSRRGRCVAGARQRAARDGAPPAPHPAALAPRTRHPAWRAPSCGRRPGAGGRAGRGGAARSDAQRVRLCVTLSAGGRGSRQARPPWRRDWRTPRVRLVAAGGSAWTPAMAAARRLTPSPLARPQARPPQTMLYLRHSTRAARAAAGRATSARAAARGRARSRACGRTRRSRVRVEG